MHKFIVHIQRVTVPRRADGTRSRPEAAHRGFGTAEHWDSVPNLGLQMSEQTLGGPGVLQVSRVLCDNLKSDKAVLDLQDKSSWERTVPVRPTFVLCSLPRTFQVKPQRSVDKKQERWGIEPTPGPQSCGQAKPFKPCRHRNSGLAQGPHRGQQGCRDLALPPSDGLPGLSCHSAPPAFPAGGGQVASPVWPRRRERRELGPTHLLSQRSSGPRGGLGSVAAQMLGGDWKKVLSNIKRGCLYHVNL